MTFRRAKQLSDTSDLFDELRWREAVGFAARSWGVDDREVRPCLATMREIETGLRNKACYILGTEMRRLGKSLDSALQIAMRWNTENLPPLPDSEVETTIRSAFRGEKKYGCIGALAYWCIGRNDCPWFNEHVAGRRQPKGRTTIIDFDRLGWRGPHVTPLQRLVYQAVTEMERIRGVGPGGCVITSVRQLARLVGASHSGVCGALLVLQALGLIEFEPGRPRGTGLPPKGCTIRRVIPIPNPPVRNPGWGREVRRRFRVKSRPAVQPLKGTEG